MKYFNRKQTAYLLAATAVIASVITFYATNLIWSDVSNMYYMSVTRDFITSLPFVFISVQMVLFFSSLLNLYTGPGSGRRTVQSCANMLKVFSLAGIAVTIVSYTVIYSSFMTPSPFRYASVVLLVYYVVCFAAAVYLSKWGRTLAETETERIKFGRAVFRFVRTLFVFFAFNRLGALLVSPVYIQWRTFWLTFPFYLSLLIPAALLALMIYAIMDFGGKGARSGLIISAIIFAADIILNAYIFIFGRANTRFTAAISPALPIERLLSKPIAVILCCIVTTILSAYALIYMLKRCENDKRRN